MTTPPPRDPTDPKRQMVILGVMLLFLGGTYVYQYLNPPPPEPEVSETEPAETTTDAGGSDAAEQEWIPRSTLEEAPTEVIETEFFRAEISALGGLKHLYLAGDVYTDEEGNPLDLVTTDRAEFLTFRTRIRNLDIPDDAVWHLERIDDRSVRLQWRGHGFEVGRTIVAGQGPYQLWSTVRVKNLTDTARPVGVTNHLYHYISAEEEDAGFIGRPSPTKAFLICQHDGEVEREMGEKVEETLGFGSNDVRFAGITDNYFSRAIAAGDPGPLARRCRLESDAWGDPEEPVGHIYAAELRQDRIELQPGQEEIRRTLFYFGPNDREALRTAGHDLIEVIDLGWFAFIANGLTELLRAIHGFVPNWGFAIILLTLLVKLLLFPLTLKSFQSMARMRQLKPKMDALNEKYGDDRERKSAAMMELYRKEKINPASGCLPSLLQMPIWFALYRSLSTNVELFHQPFALWITDLSQPDPYFVLPAFVGLLMHVQQRLTPTSMDPAQAKMMMYMMPIMIGGFMLFLPAGLGLYMVTNSTLTMLQQRWIYARLDAQTAAQEAAAKSLDEDDEDDADDEDDETTMGEGDEEEASAATPASTRRRSVKTKKKKRSRG